MAIAYRTEGSRLRDRMTPNEKSILRGLVAVAWADGKVEAPEEGVIEGLLCAFDASDEEETEILEWAKEKRTLKDIPIAELTGEDRELLLANAALLAHADGEQSDDEKKLLDTIVEVLGFSSDEAEKILDSAKDGALQLGTKPLVDLPDDDEDED